MEYKHLFGPVPSRRLGISLGIDLVPYKTCSLNCIYCECGKTTNLTIQRKEYIPLNEIINELNNFFKKNQTLDYITFSGAGEPTLYSKLGEIINYIKKYFPKFPIALLTNSTLLYDKKLQDEIKDIDLILPSLDAVTEESFNKINRPCSLINLNKVINGLIKFRKIFKGKIWLEIFIIPGINDSDKELKLFKKVLKKINPDKIQLNSLDRPGTEKWVKKATLKDFDRVKSYLYPLPIEIITIFNSRTRSIFEKGNIENRILSIIERRPCTLEDLKNISGLHINIINKFIKIFLENNKIRISNQKRGNFFIINK